jgi:hypothetical protein
MKDINLLLTKTERGGKFIFHLLTKYYILK